jgi:hypothetical protein
VQIIRKSKFPWPVVALIVGAALLIAIIAVLPRGPHVTKPPAAAQVPPQPTAEQIQLTDIKIVPGPAGDAIYLDAVVHNTGNSAITGAQVSAQFMNKGGRAVGMETAAVQGLQGGTTTQDLTTGPIKPNEARPVRIYFEHTPKGWNHEVPQLSVTTVTGTTS